LPVVARKKNRPHLRPLLKHLLLLHRPLKLPQHPLLKPLKIPPLVRLMLLKTPLPALLTQLRTPLLAPPTLRKMRPLVLPMPQKALLTLLKKPLRAARRNNSELLVKSRPSGRLFLLPDRAVSPLPNQKEREGEPQTVL
jgi:hypothetical protein